MIEPRNRNHDVVRRRGPMGYIGICESTKKQIQHGKFRRNKPQDFAILFPTTTSILNADLTSLFIVVGSEIIYYVEGIGANRLFHNVLSFQAMKQKLIQILRSKCVISYESNGFGLKAIQRHFEVDSELIEKAQKHDVIGKLRGLKVNVRGDPYTRERMLAKFGLGNNQLNILNPNKIIQLWNDRLKSKTYVSLMLAWGMMNALAIRYLTILALWTCQWIFKREVPNWRQRLQEMKVENAKLLMNFVETELKLDLSSEDVQALLAKI